MMTTPREIIARAIADDIWGGEDDKALAGAVLRALREAGYTIERSPDWLAKHHTWDPVNKCPIIDFEPQSKPLPQT